MASSDFLQSPGQYVSRVLSQLSQQLNVLITSHYLHQASAVTDTQLTYRCGHCRPLKKLSNDGRERYEIKLVFDIYISTAKTGFDETALDLAMQIEHLFLNNYFGSGDSLEKPRKIRSKPAAFDAEKGYLKRTVKIFQRIAIGSVETDEMMIEGAKGYVNGVTKPSIVIGSNATATQSGS